MPNGDAHLSFEGEQASASDPLPYFQRHEQAEYITVGILVSD